MRRARRSAQNVLSAFGALRAWGRPLDAPGSAHRLACTAMCPGHETGLPFSRPAGREDARRQRHPPGHLRRLRRQRPNPFVWVNAGRSNGRWMPWRAAGSLGSLRSWRARNRQDHAAGRDRRRRRGASRAQRPRCGVRVRSAVRRLHRRPRQTPGFIGLAPPTTTSASRAPTSSSAAPAITTCNVSAPAHTTATRSSQAYLRVRESHRRSWVARRRDASEIR